MLLYIKGKMRTIIDIIKETLGLHTNLALHTPGLIILNAAANLTLVVSS